MTPVKPIPDGYHTVTPYILVQGADKLIDFVKKAFDAKETERYSMPNGTIGHAEDRLGDSVIMVSDAQGEDYKPMELGFICMWKIAMLSINALWKAELHLSWSQRISFMVIEVRA